MPTEELTTSMKTCNVNEVYIGKNADSIADSTCDTVYILLVSTRDL